MEDYVVSAKGKGYIDHASGAAIEDNPFAGGTPGHDEWVEGWCEFTGDFLPDDPDLDNDGVLH